MNKLQNASIIQNNNKMFQLFEIVRINREQKKKK